MLRVARRNGLHAASLLPAASRPEDAVVSTVYGGVNHASCSASDADCLTGMDADPEAPQHRYPNLSNSMHFLRVLQAELMCACIICSAGGSIQSIYFAHIFRIFSAYFVFFANKRIFCTFCAYLVQIFEDSRYFSLIFCPFLHFFHVLLGPF